MYNGWTNYETWNVALWLFNDEGNYNALQHRLRFVFGKHITEFKAREIVRLMFTETPDGVRTTLDQSAKINWREIADAIEEELEN